MAALAVVAAWSPARATPPDGPVLLEVRINGRATNKIGDFVAKGGKLYATRKELRELGLAVEGAGDAEEVALTDVPHLEYVLDEQTQTVELKAPISDLRLTRLEPDGAASMPLSKTSSGLLFNYNASLQAGKGATGAVASGETRLFGAWGVASTTFTAVDLPDADKFVRLDSTYTFSDTDALRRFRLGDVITGGLPWTRPVRLAGIQAAVDFSMQPNLVTFPTPEISGQAAVPSTVNVLVNGMQALARDVPAGPFNVSRVPLVSGANSITVGVRDTTGALSTQTLSFYVSPDLMKAGLSSFSVELGSVRRNYGIFSDDYGELAGSGTWRYGVSNALTVSTHAEAQRDLGLFEAGVTRRLGQFGVLTLASGASDNNGRAGGLLYGAFERETRRYSLTFSAQAVTPSFQDIAGLNGSPPPRLVLQAGAGFTAGRYGNFGLALAKLDGALTNCSCGAQLGGIVTSVPNGSTPGPDNERSMVGSTTYSTRIFGKLSLSATAYQDFENHSGGGLISLSIPLGGRATAAPSLNYQGGRLAPSLQLVKPTDKPGDLGGQIYDTEGGPTTRRFADLQYKSPWGVMDFGVDSEASTTLARASLNGSAALIDGGLFFSAPIQDSFAVVDTGHRPGMQVYLENQPAGRTNADGKLLLPNLKSYNAAKIGVEPSDLDLDSDLLAPDVFRRPGDRAGLIVRFDIRSTEQALLTLVDAHGAPIPAGSQAALADSPERFPVGYDGQLLVTRLGPHNFLQIALAGGAQCTVEFDYKRVKGEIARIGPLACTDVPLSRRLGLRGRRGPG